MSVALFPKRFSLILYKFKHTAQSKQKYTAICIHSCINPSICPSDMKGKGTMVVLFWKSLKFWCKICVLIPIRGRCDTEVSFSRLLFRYCLKIIICAHLPEFIFVVVWYAHLQLLQCRIWKLIFLFVSWDAKSVLLMQWKNMAEILPLGSSLVFVITICSKKLIIYSGNTFHWIMLPKKHSSDLPSKHNWLVQTFPPPL